MQRTITASANWPMLSTFRVISPFALASPHRDRARGIVARGRRARSSGCRRPTRRCARRAACRWSAMRRRSRRGSGWTTCRRATFWNSSPSCGRRASVCRRRAASAKRSILPCQPRRKKKSPPCPRWRARCSTSWKTWRPWPRPSSRTPPRPWRAANGRGAMRCWLPSASITRPRSRVPAPASTSGRACRNGRSRRPRRRPAASPSSRARRACAWRR